MIVDVIGAAISGGADSVYLLHWLLQQGEPVLVLHVNHGLRGVESDGDEAFVRNLARELRLEVLVHRAQPAPGNLEQQARRARYRWFRELLAQGIVHRVALGHTRSDQAETVLFRFLRGAGTAGLAGIRPETSDGIWRPLLEIARQEVRHSLQLRGLAWREDSSNRDLAFARNRIRQHLLPRLQREWNPEIEKSLAQMADWAREEEHYWTRTLRRWERRHFRRDGNALLVEWPRKIGIALQRRLARLAIERVKGDLLGIDFAHVEAVRQLRNGRLSLPGLDVERSFSWLRLSPPNAEEEVVTGEIELELRPADSVYNGDEIQLDWERVSGPPALRTWRDGDRYQRVGRGREERLKLLFQKARVPVWERRRWPVLLFGGKIGWTRGFGVAAGLERTESTQMVLVVRDRAGIPNRNP